MRLLRPLTAFALPLAVVAALAACSSGGADPDDRSSSPSASATPSADTNDEADAQAAEAAQVPATEDEGSDGGADEDAGDDAVAGTGAGGTDGGTGTSGSGGAGADCFPGTWTAPVSELMAAENVGGGTVTVDGEARIEMGTDGSFALRLDGFSGRVSDDRTNLLMTAIADGIRGTWQLADDHATVTEADTNTPWRMQMTGTVDDTVITIGTGVVQDLDLVLPAQARFECAGDELRVVEDDGTDVFRRD